MLLQIGFASDEELAGDLGSPEHTMAKVFYAMLTKTYDMALFSWERTPRTANSAVDAALSKPDWLSSDTPTVSYEQEQAIDGIPTDTANLFLILQSMMNRFRFDWFHPDDMHMFVRTPDKEYIVIEAEYRDRAFIHLRVRMDRGSDRVFTALMDGITAAFGAAAPFTDEVFADGVPERISV
jgi:hypothetical protein